MLLVYLFVCTLLFALGILAEKYIFKNGLTRDLILTHSVVWYTPIVNFAAICYLIHKLGRWYRDKDV